MKAVYVVLVAAAVLAVRLALFRRRKRGRAPSTGAGDAPAAQIPGIGRVILRRWNLGSRRGDVLGDLGTIAEREIRERVRGRIFRIGTILILVVVALAIIIPTLHKGGNQLTLQRVGVVGGLSASGHRALELAAASNDDAVTLRAEPSLAAAEHDLRVGTLDLAIAGGDEILLAQPAGSKNSQADSGLVRELAEYLGVLHAYRAAGLTAAQELRVSGAKPVPVRALESGSSNTPNSTSVIGIVLLFLMLTQYNTWILIGVMQEKSSRVVEVLLAAVRPIQLLGGKVLGIGLVALAQAALIVGFALALADAVGSDLLKGSAPLTLGSELLWFVLGYAFYCWVYAAAGSMAERQDQVQTLALPLSVPIIVGYVLSLTAVSSGSADLFVKVLAYVPPTAPFCMSALVALGQVSWWGFVVSALVTVAATWVMARAAAGIYRRAVLRTGGRVHLRDVLAR